MIIEVVPNQAYISAAVNDAIGAVLRYIQGMENGLTCEEATEIATAQIITCGFEVL
ncbi:Uncharacterised protein [Mycobacteroides abscessus subsp. massiliense]|nr:Uncharacterised protein [Mycobacteroides abscessus subsp. massiliense]